ncbi:MAG: DEAD/DEAH box helicase [Alphaproteobacteria bacterium]|nr:DEAD/DEAH box helicase [Alphaproteobacteria bacterium]NCQ88131.1 DEAD/DEAH box helicase [Alphaproteobacteria bacterium]NCT05362.1 DEAD/DEAH box helicase [Alphaproteobacteria bacterium]
MKFEDLGLDPNTLKAIADMGYTEATPIQAMAIPLIQMTRDVVGLAQTGTGKTASFTLPMIDALSGGRAKARMPRSLVLAPTRELAAQVADNFDQYGKYHKLSKVLLVGGTSMGDQIKLLEKGVDVLIATPGRLLDLFERGSILLNDIKILVIDEADRMMDMGFIPDIEKIVSLLPPTRQTLLFSATMPPEIRKLTAKFLTNPKEISVTPAASAAVTVEQFLVHTQPKDKERLLEKLLKQEKVENAFVFLNRKKDVDILGKYLKSKGYPAAAMHGDMAQATRTETLEAFKTGKVDILVCSDVAARGIDVKNVSHVFNYDVPMSADDYIHRIGRTGRAGATGRAWMFTTPRDEKFLDAIEKLLKKQLEVVDLKSKSEKSDDKKTAEKPALKQSSKVQDNNKKPQKERPTVDKNGDKTAHLDDGKHFNYSDNAPADQPGFGDDMPNFFK